MSRDCFVCLSPHYHSVKSAAINYIFSGFSFHCVALSTLPMYCVPSCLSCSAVCYSSRTKRNRYGCTVCTYDPCNEYSLPFHFQPVWSSDYAVSANVSVRTYVCVVTTYVRAYVIGWDDCTNVPLVCYCTVRMYIRMCVRTYVTGTYLPTYVGVVSPSFSTSFHSQ